MIESKLFLKVEDIADWLNENDKEIITILDTNNGWFVFFQSRYKAYTVPK